MYLSAITPTSISLLDGADLYKPRRENLASATVTVILSSYSLIYSFFLQLQE